MESRAGHAIAKTVRLNPKLSISSCARRRVLLEGPWDGMRTVLNWVGWIALGAALVALAVVSLN
jgi:hypothetical protein